MAELMGLHAIVIALVRMLTLLKQIDASLSTRDTGDTVLLADSSIYDLPKSEPRGTMYERC
jgi:hypothetical protein